MLFGVGGDHYELKAQFLSANSIEPGGEVILSGLPIGVIKSITLNKDTFMADVVLSINKSINLPKDSQFRIGSVSMTDPGIIKVIPGKSNQFLRSNDFLTNTQSYQSIEQSISNYIFSGTSLSNK